MTDREKVIKGLKAHGYKDCKHCPYWGTGRGGMSECTQLARDALALLTKETFWDSLSEADLMEPMRHFED